MASVTQTSHLSTVILKGSCSGGIYLSEIIILGIFLDWLFDFVLGKIGIGEIIELIDQLSISLEICASSEGKFGSVNELMLRFFCWLTF